VTAAGFSPRARRDLARAIRWIAKDNPSAARALLDAVGHAAIRIGDHPQSGAARRDLTGGPYRFVTLTGFRYLIVYTENQRPPLIVRIVHSARDLPRLLRDLV
jgi:toxin ParE1/3/4